MKVSVDRFLLFFSDRLSAGTTIDGRDERERMEVRARAKVRVIVRDGSSCRHAVVKICVCSIYNVHWLETACLPSFFTFVTKHNPILTRYSRTVGISERVLSALVAHRTRDDELQQTSQQDELTSS